MDGSIDDRCPRHNLAWDRPCQCHFRDCSRILRLSTSNKPLPISKSIRVKQEDYFILPPENHHSPSCKLMTPEDYLCSLVQGLCTTTSPGYTFPCTCTILNYNVQGLSGNKKLEKIVKMMIAKGINGYCLQETWKNRTYTTTIR